MNDAELLRRYVQERSEAAFTELVNGYVNFVYSAALRQVGGDAHLAQDVTQSVFIDLAAKAHSLSPRTVLSGWLYTSTRFSAAKAVRTEQRWRLREHKANAMQEPSSPDESPWTQLRPIIDQAMHDLKDRDRNAVLLRYFENRPLAQVGARLGLSEDAARKQVDRSLEKLRALLIKRGVTSSAAALAVLLTSQAVNAAPAGITAQLAGTALASAAAGVNASLTLVEIITMSKIKFAALATVLLAGVATPLYIQHESQVQLRRENQSLRQENEQLRGAGGEAAQPSDIPDQANSVATAADQQANELVRLRAEVARLRQDGLSRGQPPGANSGSGIDPALEAAFSTWAARATQLKQRLEQMPDKKIPEMQFLTEKDWFDAVKHSKPFETDADYRRALSDLRSSAKANFDRILQQALRAYGAANNNLLPTDLSLLKPYFETPVDDSILQRYALLRTGTLAQLSGGDYLIGETAPAVDDEFDTVHQLSLNGINTRSVNKTADAVQEAGIQYARANNGMLPTDPAQLAPYLKQPIDPAIVQRFLNRVPSGVTTLEQLKASGAMH
jgi:RNA polymerase sigma factor (sigma-70 family)